MQLSLKIFARPANHTTVQPPSDRHGLSVGRLGVDAHLSVRPGLVAKALELPAPNAKQTPAGLLQ